MLPLGRGMECRLVITAALWRQEGDRFLGEADDLVWLHADNGSVPFRSQRPCVAVVVRVQWLHAFQKGARGDRGDPVSGPRERAPCSNASAGRRTQCWCKRWDWETGAPRAGASGSSSRGALHAWWRSSGRRSPATRPYNGGRSHRRAGLGLRRAEPRAVPSSATTAAPSMSSLWVGIDGPWSDSVAACSLSSSI